METHNPEHLYLHSAWDRTRKAVLLKFAPSPELILQLTTEDNRSLTFKEFENHGGPDALVYESEKIDRCLPSIEWSFTWVHLNDWPGRRRRVSLSKSRDSGPTTHRYEGSFERSNYLSAKFGAIDTIAEIRVFSENELCFCLDQAALRGAAKEGNLRIYEENMTSIQIDAASSLGGGDCVEIVSYKDMLESVSFQPFVLSLDPADGHIHLDPPFFSFFALEASRSEFSFINGAIGEVTNDVALVFKASIPALKWCYVSLPVTQGTPRRPMPTLLSDRCGDFPSGKVSAVIENYWDRRDWGKRYWKSRFSPEYLLGLVRTRKRRFPRSDPQVLLDYPSESTPRWIHFPVARWYRTFVAPLDWYRRKGHAVLVRPPSHLLAPEHLELSSNGEALEVEFEYGLDRMAANARTEGVLPRIVDIRLFNADAESVPMILEAHGLESTEPHWPKPFFFVSKSAFDEIITRYVVEAAQLGIDGEVLTVTGIVKDEASGRGRIYYLENSNHWDAGNSGDLPIPRRRERRRMVNKAAVLSGLWRRESEMSTAHELRLSPEWDEAVMEAKVEESIAKGDGQSFEIEVQTGGDSVYYQPMSLANATVSGFGLSVTLCLKGNGARSLLIPVGSQLEGVEILEGDFFFTSLGESEVRRARIRRRSSDAERFEFVESIPKADENRDLEGVLTPRTGFQRNRKLPNGTYWAIGAFQRSKESTSREWRSTRPFQVRQVRPPRVPKLYGPTFTTVADRGGVCRYSFLIGFESVGGLPHAFRVERALTPLGEHPQPKDFMPLAGGFTLFPDSLEQSLGGEMVSFEVSFVKTASYCYALFTDNEIKAAKLSCVHYRVWELNEELDFGTSDHSKGRVSQELHCHGVRSVSRLPSPVLRQGSETTLMGITPSEVTLRFEVEDRVAIESALVLVAEVMSQGKSIRLRPRRENDTEVYTLSLERNAEADLEVAILLRWELAKPAASRTEPWTAGSEDFLEILEAYNDAAFVTQSRAAQPLRCAVPAKGTALP